MFKHRLLPKVLHYKFQHNPNIGKGISTKDGVLTAFHPDIAPFPTDEQLQQWVNEYEALPADHPVKDPRAAKLKEFDALGNGVEELKAWIRANLI